MKNFKSISFLLLVSVSTFAQILFHEDSLHLYTFVYQDSTSFSKLYSLKIDSIKVDTISFKYSKVNNVSINSKFWNVTITSIQTNSILGISKMSIENNRLISPKFSWMSNYGNYNSIGDVFWNGTYSKFEKCNGCSTINGITSKYIYWEQNIIPKVYIAYQNKIYFTYNTTYYNPESNFVYSYNIINFSGVLFYKINTHIENSFGGTMQTNNLRLLSIDGKSVSLYTLQTITGIIVQNDNQKITIFPNPTTSKVHLTTGFEGESEIVLTDITGKTLQTYTTTSNESYIDLSAYSNGMYFFKITNRLGKHIAKVMKIVDN